MLAGAAFTVMTVVACTARCKRNYGNRSGDSVEELMLLRTGFGSQHREIRRQSSNNRFDPHRKFS